MKEKVLNFTKDFRFKNDKQLQVIGINNNIASRSKFDNKNYY